MRKNIKKAEKQGRLPYMVIFLILGLLSGCASTVNFAYAPQSTTPMERKAVADVPVLLSVVDMRAEPEIMGYINNQYGMRMSKIKSKDLDISQTIYSNYREKLIASGFHLVENPAESKLKLTLTLTSFLGEMRDGVFTQVSTGVACMKLSFTRVSDEQVLSKGNICGKGEKSTPFIAGKKDISEALSLALDDAFDKLMTDTEIIEQLNKFANL